jgi:Protein of unknown function (DUF669)
MSEISTVLDVAFVPEQEEGTPPPTLLPKGKYAAEITDATVRTSKNGNAQMVNLGWTIVEGDYENRMVFQPIIISHATSPDAQKFGRQRFKDVCSACGIVDPVTDLEVLKYKKCTVSVGTEEDKNGEYEPKNKVTRVVPYVAPWNGVRGNSESIAQAREVPGEKSHSGALNGASETPPAFKASDEGMNDKIRW